MSISQTSNPEMIANLLTMSKAKGFLGREFLTWLWYHSEISDEMDVISKDGVSIPCRIWIDDRIVMESSSAKAHIYSLRGGDPSQSIETAAALQSGKLVKQLKIGMDINEIGEFTAVLNADDLTPRSLALPPVPELQGATSEDQEQKSSPLGIRVEQTEAFLKVLDGLFSQFLDERIQPKWETEGVEKIRAWIKNRSASEGEILH